MASVQFSEAEELAVAQPREDPALDHLHSNLDFGLIPGMGGTRRQDRRAVVARQVGVGGGGFGLVAAGALDGALEVIRDEQRWYCTQVFEGADVRADPVG